MTYETPKIIDRGSLVELTAMINVGGPVDAHGTAPPGHSCPPGSQNANSTPPCNGNGGGVSPDGGFQGDPNYNPNNPGNPGLHPNPGNGNGKTLKDADLKF